MDRLSLVISILTLLVTAVIPFAIYRLGRKGERITNAILSEQRRLLSAQRLDILAVQAEQMGDPNDLSEILKEARQLANGRSLERIIESYWRNPQVPLCGSVRTLDSRGALITAQHLPAKLEGKSEWQAMRELSEFVSRARSFGDSPVIASRIADWIMSRFGRGSDPSHYQIRELLEVSPASVSYSFLEPLDIIDLHLPIPVRINVLAGVCDGYLAKICYYPRSEQRVTETTEKSDGNYELSRSLAEKLGLSPS